MPSELASETSRANGAKSKGPKTAETRAKSARNSLKHGFTSRHSILLYCENPDEFQEVEDDYLQTYQPGNAAERHMVAAMISAAWRIRRANAMEAAIMDIEMVRNEAAIEQEFEQLGACAHMGLTFRSLADGSSSLALISRYESRLEHKWNRAHKGLLDLRRSAAAAELQPQTVQPQPIPPEPGSPAQQEETPASQPEASASAQLEPAAAQPPRRLRCENKFEKTNPAPRPDFGFRLPTTYLSAPSGVGLRRQMLL